MSKLRYILDYHDKVDIDDKKEIVRFIINKVGKDGILEHYTKEVKEITIDIRKYIGDVKFIDELYNKIKEYIERLNTPK